MRHGFSISTAALALVSGCAAHMTLQFPVPYGNGTLDNSPLQASGSDYPCKQRAGVYEVVELNHWAAGETQTVSFRGSAVHGGGSCQFSVTTDLQPTKASQWKVIHSVIGGCPANAEGNLVPGESAATFDITLPSEMPDGRYTFAWTWLNRRGNRELYMNCAPIIVTSHVKDVAFLEGLPDMFVANLPGTACATQEDFDYAYPQPGVSVTTGKAARPAKNLSGTGCASVTRLGAGSGSMHYPSAVETDASRRVPSVSMIVAADANKGSGGIEPPSTTGGPTPAPSGQTDATNTPSTSAGPRSASCMPCQEDGAILCIDEVHFGICDRGCAYRQLLAEGTHCLDGAITKREEHGPEGCGANPGK